MKNHLIVLGLLATLWLSYYLAYVLIRSKMEIIEHSDSFKSRFLDGFDHVMRKDYE